MALDDMLGGFDPNTAIDDLIRRQDGAAPQTSVNPDFLANRLYRKLKQQQDEQDRPAPIKRPTNLRPKEDAPDFSSRGIPLSDLPDFADQGTPIEQVQQPAPTVSLGVTGQAKAAMKGLARGAIDQVGGISKGLSIASKALPGTSQAVAEAAAGMDPAANWPLPGQTTPRDAMPPPETRPVQQMPGYQTGQAIQDFAERNVPMTPQEQDSIAGRVGTGIGAVAPYLAAGAINPALGVAAGVAGFAASTAADTFDAAIKKGASEEDAAKAAGYSALVGGALGVLPLGMVLKPIRIASPVFAGRAAGYLKEAVKSGLTFATVGEAQEYLLQKIAKDFYDPEAGYSPDAKRAIASLITGGILGAGGHFMERRARRAAAAEPAPEAPPPDGPAALGGPSQGAGPERPPGGPAPGEGPAPKPESERAGVGREKLEKILRYFGFDEATIKGMSHTEMADAVLKAMKSSGPQAKPNEATSKQEGSQENASRTEKEQWDTLIRYGWTIEELQAMSPAQRRREFHGAVETGRAEQEHGQEKHNPTRAEARSPSRVRDMDVAETAMQQPESSSLQELRGQGGESGSGVRSELSGVSGRSGATSAPELNIGQEGQQQGVRARQSPLDNVDGSNRQSAEYQIRDHQRSSDDRIGGGKVVGNELQDIEDASSNNGRGTGSVAAIQGTREAPIRPTTAEDVRRAQPIEPKSPAQAEAENYQHAHLELPQFGLEGGRSISVETGLGQERKGVDSDGKPWSVKLTHAAYGRIKGSKGADGEPLDIFIGPHPTSPHVFVVDQHHPGGGGWDEHKILAGFRTPIDALHAYAHSYNDAGKDRIGHVTAMGPDEFKQWLAGDTTKPLKKEPGAPDVAAQPGNLSTEAAAASTAVPTESPLEAASVKGSTSATRPTANRSSEPLSLLQFIASKGGVAPHAELRALDLAGDHRVQLPGQRGFFGVVRPAGMPLDLMREAAEEAGYFRGEQNKTSTVRDLLDAIDVELRGGRHAAEGEEGHASKRQRGSARESSDAARDKAIVAAREDIAAEYEDLPEDLLDRAAEIMADERLDIDSAVEMAAVRMVADDADYGISHTDLQDTFGEDVTDAIRPRPASENGEPAGKQAVEGSRPGETEEAGGDGAPVQDHGRARRQEAATQRERAPAGERIEPSLPAKQLFVEIGGRRIPKPMTDYAEASRAYVQAIDVTGATSSGATGPAAPPAIIVDSDGKKVASISYNGRVWGPSDEPLYNPYAIESTSAGKQAVLPGAEKIGEGEQAQRQADKPLKPAKAQKPADEGLFGDERNQADLLDHMRAVERVLGADADRVAPVDVARAAEIMAEQPGIEPEAAFGQAVIKNAVEQGFITEQEAVDAYGEEVRDVLEPSREGASGSGAHAVEGGAAPDEVRAGGAAEDRELPGGREAGARAQGAEEAASDAEAKRDGAASGNEAARDEAGNAAENQPAAKATGLVEGAIDVPTWAEILHAGGKDIVLVQKLIADISGRNAVPYQKLTPEQKNDLMDRLQTQVINEAFRAAQAERGTTMGVQIGDLLLRTNLSKEQLHKWILDRVPTGAVKIYHTSRALADESPVNLEAAIRLKGFDEPFLTVYIDQDALAKEPTNGVQASVPPSAAPAGAEAVQPAEPRRKAAGDGDREGGRSERAVRGADEGRAEGAGRVSEGTVREPSNGAGAPDADRLSEPRTDDSSGRRAKRDAERAANLVEGENHVIEPGSLDEARGPKAKALGNIEALDLANKILAEDRPATAAEQQVLARYVGWGGLKGAFPDTDGRFADGYEDIGKRLQDVLPPEEYATARRSIQYAHYTAEDVVRSMWDAVGRLGFKGGQVFEPGMGTGNFAGMMPADVAARSHYAGLELDHTTARIAKLLYPKWGIRQDDFTKTRLPENTYDLVIGNPPFADVAVQSDPKYKQGFLLHDYFFAKSLDAVRPGGLLAFVTTAGTMNKADPAARQYLADRADLVGAVRLPGGAFEKNAGTKVTTDILFLRKRLPGDVAGDRGWTDVRPTTMPNKNGMDITGNVSAYFLDHPEMILGEHGFFDTLYQNRYAVRMRSGQDLKADLAAAVERLPQDVMSDWQQAQAESVKADFETTEKKEGTYYVGPDGNLHQVSNGVGMPVRQRGKGVENSRTAAEVERIKGLVPIRDSLRAVYAADLAGDTANAQRAREALNRHYDAFVEKFGPINKAVIQTRRPNVIQMEGERQKAREEARYAGERFREGDFDDRKLVESGAATSVIARERQAARDAAQKAGRPSEPRSAWRSRAITEVGCAALDQLSIVEISLAKSLARRSALPRAPFGAPLSIWIEFKPALLDHGLVDRAELLEQRRHSAGSGGAAALRVFRVASEVSRVDGARASRGSAFFC